MNRSGVGPRGEQSAVGFIVIPARNVVRHSTWQFRSRRTSRTRGHTASEWQEETLGSEDFYREDIEDLLQEGAWTEGFNGWTEYTGLEESHGRVVDDLGLF